MIHLTDSSSGVVRRRYRTTLRCHNSFPQCVALIDLLFILLLFVALTTQVTRLSGIRVDLPQVEAPLETVLGKLIVTVTPGEYESDCRIFFRDRELSLDELRQIFSQQTDRHEKTVVIRADRKVPSGVLYELVASANEAKLAALIAVQAPDARTEMRFE